MHNFVLLSVVCASLHTKKSYFVLYVQHFEYFIVIFAGSYQSWRIEQTLSQGNAAADVFLGISSFSYVLLLIVLVENDLFSRFRSRNCIQSCSTEPTSRCCCLTSSDYEKQDVTLTGRNTTGPFVQCYSGAIIRLEAAWCHRLAWAGEAACRPTA